jgi:hypothetical protein
VNTLHQRDPDMEAPLVKTVAELLAELAKLKLEKAHAHIRYWFRGQSNAGRALCPGVYRPGFGSYRDEEDRFKTEQHLNQDFGVLSAGLRTGRETDVDIYFLQQHYRMPTRLLDWTSNPLAGLYFACGGDESSDGELFVIDAYGLSSIGIATSRHSKFRGAIQTIAEFGLADQLPDCILAVRPDHFDRRIALQRSLFHVSRTE